jgi:hypothetical protein
MVLTLLVAVAVLVGAVWAYAGRMQCVTLWAGRAITRADMEAMLPTGAQDAITPPWQTRLNLVWMIGFLVFLIVGLLQVWYLGILGVVVGLIARAIVEAFLPKQVAWYLRQITASLANREANYQRDGDVLRAEAAHEMFDRIALLLERAVSSNRRVPSIVEARSTPFG